MFKKLFYVVFCVLITETALSSDFKILMRVNGRYYAVEDEFSKAFKAA